MTDSKIEDDWNDNWKPTDKVICEVCGKLLPNCYCLEDDDLYDDDDDLFNGWDFDNDDDDYWDDWDEEEEVKDNANYPPEY